MIPTREQILSLWDTYNLPVAKRTHVSLVCAVALYLADALYRARGVVVDIELLRASALLHDIDKAVQKREGEHHPDTGVRLLREGGMDAVADIVRTHTLGAILDPTRAPTRWEQKLLYLADKMVKYEVVGVDQRFAQWRAEHLPKEAYDELDATYPKVKELEQEVGRLTGLDLSDVAHLAQEIKTSTMSTTV